MAEDPLGRLTADARERPLLYASVAVAGLAGVAAAVALGARAVPPGRASGAASLLRTARTVLDEASARAASSAGDVADRARDAADGARRSAAGNAAPDADRTTGDRPGTDGDPDGRADRDGARRDARTDEASAGGVGPGTAAVFLGTLLSKAFTGWMRLQAEERARAQGAAAASGTGSAGAAAGVAASPSSAFDLRAYLEDLNVTELRALASEHEIEGRSSMNKDELVEALCGER